MTTKEFPQVFTREGGVLGALSPAEAARYIGVSLTTLKYMENEPDGDPPPHFRVGRKKLYRVAALNAWMKRREAAQKQVDAAPALALAALDGGVI